jgi:CheY-like chemotaxis protein
MTGQQHILIVEDQVLLGMMLQDVLEDLGYQASMVSRVDEALAFVETNAPTAAILDINLGDEDSYPVARVLREKAIPFMFTSGYSGGALPKEFEGHRTVQKPYSPPMIGGQLSELLQG